MNDNDDPQPVYTSVLGGRVLRVYADGTHTNTPHPDGGPTIPTRADWQPLTLDAPKSDPNRTLRGLTYDVESSSALAFWNDGSRTRHLMSHIDYLRLRCDRDRAVKLT